MLATGAALLAGLLYCLVITTWIVHRPSASQNLRTDVRPERVAIIGAGIGGASAAMQIHMLNRNIRSQKITIFERGPAVGGRVRSTFLYPGTGGLRVIEEGATHFFEDDWCIGDAMREVRLRAAEDWYKFHYRDPLAWPDNDVRTNVKCNEESTSWQELLRGRWKYGRAWSDYHTAVKAVLGRWQSFGSPWQYRWRNITKQFQRAGLNDESFGSALADLQNITTWAMRDEVIQPCVRARISQDLSEVSTLTALMAAGKASRVHVDGGNGRRVDRMITLSRADLRFRLSIGHPNKQLLANEQELEFDAVIIASPLSSSELDMSTLDVKRPLLTPNTYLETHVTHFSTERLLSSNVSVLPLDISIAGEMTLTTSTLVDKPDIMNIQRSHACFTRGCGPGDGECDQCDEDSILYRVHSRQYMKDVDLVRLIGKEPEGDLYLSDYGIGFVKRQAWPHSIPENTGDKLKFVDSIEIAPGLYYLNGAETILSSMEMSCRMGRNVAYHVSSYHSGGRL